MDAQVDRRVYVSELATRMGVTVEWIRQMRKAGRIKARTDHPKGRPFVLESEARAIIAGVPEEPSKDRAAA